MLLDMFGGIHVRDFQSAKDWYVRLFGTEPTFLAHETEAVWELGEHRYLFIEEVPESAGHAEHVVFVDDLDRLIAEIAARGIEPVKWESYDGGVRKALFRDADGNEIGFGGAPPESS